MSDEELELLEEVAKSKGQTLEEALADLGYGTTPEQDETVSLEGTKETEPTSEVPVPATAPVQITEETPTKVEADLDVEVEPEVEPPPPPPAAEEEEVEEEEYEDEFDDAEGTIKQVCMHCGWDQSMPTVPEPNHSDKIAFLHAVLGHKVFSKRYQMFGGNLRATFRSLTIREIDTLYQAAYQAHQDGKIATTSDYYEYLNRLRLYLQITGISAKSAALHVRLPDGLDKVTNQHAESYWDDFLKEKGVFQDGVPLLKQIEDYVVENVLKTEHMQRTITHECANFNKLVSKLEACVDNPDFWKETEQPS